MASEENISRKVLRSTIWTTNSKILSQVMGLGTTLILARLLDRSDFGLMAMALAFIGLVDTFIDLGFLSAIVQAKEISRKQLSSCFWLLMGMSGLLCMVSFVSADGIARFFDEIKVADLIKFLAPVFLFAPLNIVCKGILTRDLKLDVLAKIELYSGLLKMVASIAFATMGLGVASLLYGYMFERVALTIAAARAAKWWPGLEYENDAIKKFLVFGSKSTASSLLWFLYTKADVFVIGRVLGAEILGIYTIAAQFPQTISRLVPATWNRIAYPLFARYQQSPELKQLVIRSSSLLILISLPLFAGLAAIAPDVIDLLFGPSWQDAVYPMQMLAVVAAIETATGTLPTVLNAIGRPGVNTLVNVVAVLIFPALLYLGAQYWGLEGVLWAAIFAYLYRFLAFLLLTCRFLDLRLWAYAKDHFGSMAAALVMFLGVVALAHGGGAWNIYLRMSSCILFGAASYLAIVYLISRQQIVQLLSYVRTV